MPRQVDPDQRRQLLAEAVWRVVRREGLERASVRAVAREAGLSTGSLRHYFATQSDLMVFAMRAVIDRIESRVAAVPRVADPRSATGRVLRELLPLDAERRAENEIWLAFTARAMVDPQLRSLRDEAYDKIRGACQHWVGVLLPDADDAEREVESERLFALLDGLALHAAMRPESATPDRLAAVLDHHLSLLGATAGRPGGAGPKGRRGGRGGHDGD